MALSWGSRVTNIALDEIKDPMLIRVLEEWMRGYQHEIENVPRRIAISSLRSILPYMALVELNISDDEPSYIIFGEALRRLLGRDAQGRKLRDIYHRRIFSEIKGTFTAVRLSMKPICTLNEFHVAWKTFGYRRLVLPLAVNGGGIQRMIIVLRPLNPSMRDASEWQEHVIESERDVGESSIEHIWRHQLLIE